MSITLSLGRCDLRSRLRRRLPPFSDWLVSVRRYGSQLLGSPPASQGQVFDCKEAVDKAIDANFHSADLGSLAPIAESPAMGNPSDHPTEHANTVQGCLRGSVGNFILTDNLGTRYQILGNASQLVSTLVTKSRSLASLRPRLGRQLRIRGTEARIPHNIRLFNCKM